jgi:YidC/Oxa1 family membrane protein insertase
MMNPDNKNLILAVTLSMLILIFYQLYFAPMPPPPGETRQTTADGSSPVPGAVPGIDQEALASSKKIVAIIEAPRITIENSKVRGSISLAGGRIDDLQLKNFRATNDADSPEISLLRRTGTENAYFAETYFTQITDTGYKRAVDRNLIWQANGSQLTPSTPVTLSREEDGIEYRLTYQIDDDYLITITSEARNLSDAPTQIGSWTRVLRQRPSYSEWISYAGPMGYFNSSDGNVFLDYSDVNGNISCENDSRFCVEDGLRSWVAISDKDWLAAIIPAENTNSEFLMRPVPAPDFETIRLQLDEATLAEIDQIKTGNKFEGDGRPTEISSSQRPIELAAGESMSWSVDIFAGPKKYTVLNDYQDNQNIPRLTSAIDWGWFEVIAKPMLIVLVWLNQYVSNFGIAILIMTIGIKMIFFPLANKSYRSMAKMRELAPKVKELRERFGDDRQRQQQEMMGLYRKEKVNPAAGCLPILLQIPVFFALYKVLYVTIEMRHAPFFGWVTDLSALDPTSIINLFGLLPYGTGFAPDIINVGIWPILMGITMYVQMSLNPPPPDPIQAQIFRYMPVMFTFLLATFPVGLVIYWTWNNLLTILQQMYITRNVRLESLAKNRS